jgi:hypothetical protein
MTIKWYKIGAGIFLFFLLSLNSFAQVHVNAKPFGFSNHLKLTKPVLLELDSASINSPVYNKNSITPLPAGVTIKTDPTLMNNGQWEKISPSRFIWTIFFKVKNAKSLNIYFENFNLGQNDTLFIYSADHSNFLGAFTALNNGSHFATGLLNSNTLVVEFSSRKIKKLPFRIKEIGVVLNQYEKNFGDAGPCEVPVNCSEGNDWQKQKSGVTRILVKEGSGLYWCTGSLVNNTNYDGKPYILTANHCGRNATADNYQEWVFDFKYESPDCERPAIEPQTLTLTGSELIARGNTPGKGVASDFKLLLLKDTIPGEYKLYFNGWDRTGETPNHGVVIHHPQGDIKFISTYNNITSSYYYGPENPDAPFWKVTWMETEHGHGVTEGGSSGSPLFNENGLIVGTLTGGDAFCSNLTAPDYFGKFSAHWDQGGNSAEAQLKPWLDPKNTGVTTLKGYYKDGEILSAGFYTDVNKITAGSSVKFINNSEGNIVKYIWLFEGGTPETSYEKDPPMIHYAHTGKFNVTLIVESQYNKDSIVKENYIEVIGSLYPNPFIKGVNDKVYVLVGDTPPDNIAANIYNISGKNMGTVKFTHENNKIVFSPKSLSAGVYIVYISINSVETPYKLVVLNKLQ